MNEECQHLHQGLYVGFYVSREAWFVVCEDCGATLEIFVVQADTNKKEPVAKGMTP